MENRIDSTELEHKTEQATPGYKTELTTLCYIEKDGKYLLMHRNKKEKDINKNMYIGLGGHVIKGESPDECILREVKEEAGITMTDFTMRGVVTFNMLDYTEYMFLFTCSDYEGEIDYDCDEGDLEWYDKDKIIGELPVFPGDEIFLLRLMDEEPFFNLRLDYDEKNLKRAVLNGNVLELFDVLDINGNPTGQIRERTVAHRIGSFHRTVHIWVIRQKKSNKKITKENINSKDSKTVENQTENQNCDFEVLLQKRSEDKDSFPGCYDISAAGHIDAGENVDIAAVRELYEELGIKAEVSDLRYFMTHLGLEDTQYYGKRFFNREFAKVYYFDGKDIADGDIKIQESEVDSVMWVDYDECTRMIEEKTIKESIPKDEWRKLGSVIKSKSKKE